MAAVFSTLSSSLSSCCCTSVMLFLQRRPSTRARFKGMAIVEESKDHGWCQASIEKTSDSGSVDLWSSLSEFMNEYNPDPSHASEASQSLLGLSDSLFSDVDSFFMEDEKPAEYVPAPPIQAADLELMTCLEDALYILREVLPGPMRKVGLESKLLQAWALVNDNIKVQDPLVCIKGKARLQVWLQMLATTNVQVDLHDIYAERIRFHPSHGCIYAIWTLSFPMKLQSTLNHSISESSESIGRVLLPLNLSGESKFEISSTGQVLSVESDWYVTKEGEETFDSVKMYLASLLAEEAQV